jgi:HK97 family phage prohead protease
MQHKSIDVEVKAEGQGEVLAVFSTFGVKDHDGDVTLPGAFDDGAAVRISAYNHSSWGGVLPVGKGVIHQDDTKAVMEGQFFMGTQAGKDTFTVVREMKDLGEWSYGFDIQDSEQGEHEGEKVRMLKKLKVHEVSPVLLGAGIGTQTLATKSREAKDLTDEEVLAAAAELLKRGLSLPPDLVKAVRDMDSETALTTRRKDTLRLIASAHGIDTGGEK